MSYNKYGNDGFKPIHVRDCFLFERGNVKGFATEGSETGTSGVIGPNSNPGGAPDVPCVIGIYHNFGEAAQTGPIRSIDVEQLFDYQGSVSITSASNITAIRGCQSIAAGTTFASGFLWAVQGKLTCQGTISSANFIAGVCAQLDLSKATGLTGTNVSALWADMGATISAALISSGVALLDIAHFTSTCPGATINSVIHAEALSTYFLDVSNASYPAGFSVATSVTTVAGVLAINTPQGVKYIPCYTSKS